MGDLGTPVEDWKGCVRPNGRTLSGHYCDLKKMDLTAEGPDLFEAISANTKGDSWLYLPYGPCKNWKEFEQCMQTLIDDRDTLLYTIFNKKGQPLGGAGYMRIQAPIGVIEVGPLHFSQGMQKTPMATEAIYLLLSQVFDELHYRRCEWKCNLLNEPSRKAALRFGFQFEGIFRQAGVYKGHNRDTAWYSIIDSEWPILKNRFEAWLSPQNFDAEGIQIRALSNF